MYKKIISTLVIGTLLAGTLTGCGGSSDAGSSAKSSGKTELELFSTKPENKDTIQKLVDKYNESHDDVTVKVTAPPDAGTVLKTRMAKNDMPDIVAMGGDNNYTEVEGAGMLLDLGDQDYIKDVQEAYIDTMSLTLAKAEIVIIINYDSCFFTFDMGILIPCFYYSYLFS